MDQPLPKSLSERERAILSLLAEGLADREIAYRLSVAVSTVKWYARQIYAKLGVENRHEAVRYAQGVGLLADAPPALRPPALPALVSPLLGREHELSELARLVRNPAHRLITVLGPGGMGKTVLALDIGRRATSHFADGVYFVPLAPLTSAEHIISAIAKTLDIQLNLDDPPDEQLLRYLSTRSLLLILDNFEHLLASAALLAAMLVRAPDVHLLVTSREALNLIQETRYPLHGLALPPARTEELLENSSVKLFLQSARQGQHNYVPSRDDLAAIAEICRRVGSMPLAIVLVAAWLPVLSPADMLAELGQRHDLLQVESADIPERQRSIRAIVTVAWEQLARPARDAFARLSVFRGGFTREAAEQVAGASVPILKQLVDKSLLHYTLATRRYDMHEVLRQYADQYLDGEREAIQLAHAHYYVALAEEAEQTLFSRAQVSWLRRLEAEHDNFRAVLQWTLERQHRVVALRLGGALAEFWDARGHLLEGTRWLEAALSHGDQALHQAGETAQLMEARAKGLHGLGYMLFEQSAPPASAVFARFKASYELYRTLGHDRGQVDALIGLGLVARFMDGGEHATPYLEEALSLARTITYGYGVHRALFLLGGRQLDQGDLSGAEPFLQQSLALARQHGDPWSQGSVLLDWARVKLGQGEYPEAGALYCECLLLWQTVGYKTGLINCLVGLACLAVAVQRPAERVATLFGAADGMCPAVGNELAMPLFVHEARYTAYIDAHRTTPAFAAAWARGKAMSPEAALAYALELFAGKNGSADFGCSDTVSRLVGYPGRL